MLDLRIFTYSTGRRTTAERNNRGAAAQREWEVSAAPVETIPSQEAKARKLRIQTEGSVYLCPLPNQQESLHLSQRTWVGRPHFQAVMLKLPMMKIAITQRLSNETVSRWGDLISLYSCWRLWRGAAKDMRAVLSCREQVGKGLPPLVTSRHMTRRKIISFWRMKAIDVQLIRKFKL